MEVCSYSWKPFKDVSILELGNFLKLQNLKIFEK